VVKEERKALQLNLTENFLLYNSTAERLYDEIKTLPIIDPHNHVDASSLAENRRFDNIYQLWIKPDQYKSRIMRNLGIKEKLITGDAPDYEKYLAWAECLQHTAGNPMLHWSCMELKSVFAIDEILTPSNAKAIWEKTNHLLQQEGFGALDICKKLGVEMMCTSDDLLDALEHHKTVNERSSGLTCLPSLRGDTIVNFSQPAFSTWLSKLKELTRVDVQDLNSYQDALVKRLDFFDTAGCLLSDHSFDSGFRFIPTEFSVASMLFTKVVNGQNLSAEDYIRLQSYLIHFLGKEYRKRNWKMQLHIGAQRYTSSRLRKVAGPAGGYACIGNTVDVESLCLLLDGLDSENMLPKTILYTLNPADNPVFATLTGSFSEDGVRGKIQFGPAWWFNDHHEGITQQLVTLSHYGLLSASIGMTTDSRSILSFLRHDYFRRILCNLIGEWAEGNKLAQDFSYLSELVANVSYHNCKNWIKK
jgi:glucuronate isomerase